MASRSSAAGGEGAAVWRERDAADAAVVGLELREHLTGVRFPEGDVSVAAGHGQDLVVEREGGATDRP